MLIFIIMFVGFIIWQYMNYKENQAKIKQKNIEENRWLYLESIDVDLETMSYGQRFNSPDYYIASRYVGIITEKDGNLFKSYKEIYESGLKTGSNKEFLVFSNGSITMEAKEYYESIKSKLKERSPNVLPHLDEQILKITLEKLEALEADYNKPIEIDFETRNKIILAKNKYENLKKG